MIHKIHRADDLPSVKGGTPYRIFGFGGEAVDFCDVAFPQDLRNCDTCPVAGAPQSHVSKNAPSPVACLSCRDRKWMKAEAPPAGFTVHPFHVTDDLDCKACHGPLGTYPSEKMHLLPEKDPQNPTLRLSLR